MRRSKASARISLARRRGVVGSRARPKQRRRDQQRRQQKKNLARGEQRPDAGCDRTSRAPARRGARHRRTAGNRSGTARRHAATRSMSATREREPRSRRRKRAPRIAVEQQEQRIGRRQHDDEIFRPQRAAEGDAEQEPVAEASALERGMKGVAGERPERQLNDVVIEFHRRVLEVMQAVDDQHGNERAASRRRAAAPWRRPAQRRRTTTACGQRVIGDVRAEYPVHDLNQPPRQRRQLVGAELPFAAVGERLDEVERQIGVKQRRQRGPDRKMQGQKAAERGIRAGARSSRSIPVSRAGTAAEAWRCSGDGFEHLTDRPSHLAL